MVVAKPPKPPRDTGALPPYDAGVAVDPLEDELPE